MAGVAENPSCPICFEDYNEDVNLPKVLNCGHTVCLQCLRNIVDARSVPLCPLCNIEMEIPNGGVENITTNYSLKSLISSDINSANQQAQSNTTPKHLCSTHTAKEIEYYCKTCNKGICMKCYQTTHKDHITIDLDLPETKTEALSQRTKYERLIQVKKQELEKNHKHLDEAVKKLKAFQKEEFGKFEEKANQLITEIMALCETKKTEIKKMVEESESKLTKTRDETKQQIEKLNRELECEMLLSDSTNYTLLTSVNKLRALEEKCRNITCTVPDDIYYITYENNEIELPDNILGVSTKNTLYMPQTKLFRFNIKHIKDIGIEYFSEDKYYYSGIVWRCFVVRHDDGNIGVYVVVRPQDNPELDCCSISFQFTLISDIDEKSVIRKYSNTYKTDGTGWGDNFIPWDELCDPTKGFIDSCGQFVVKFDITNMKDIKWKK